MRNSHPAPSDLLLTSEAARLLGVSAQTLRVWDGADRLRPAMRTANGVRLYARGDVEAMRRALDEQRPAVEPSPEAA